MRHSVAALRLGRHAFGDAKNVKDGEALDGGKIL